MTWFRVDDSAHNHPKLRSAGTAAIGLWTLGGSYSAHYLTDGRVHAHFIKTNATAPQLAKLVKAGLWHPAGHDCSRCPQPADGDYQIHDYLKYNLSRVQVLKSREKAADKKRRQRSGDDSDPNHDGNEPESNSIRGGNGLDSTTKSASNIRETAGQPVVSPGDSNVPRARGTQPNPAIALSPTEKEPASPAREPEPSGVPVALQPLANSLHHAGLVGLGWDLRGDEPIRIEALLKAKGLPAMVQRALTAAENSTKPVAHVRYFLGKAGQGGPWLELPTITSAEGERPPLKAVSGGWTPYQEPDASAYTNQGGF